MHKYKLASLAALLLALSIQMPAYAAIGDNISLAFHNITTTAVAADVNDGQHFNMTALCFSAVMASAVQELAFGI